MVVENILRLLAAVFSIFYSARDLRVETVEYETC
jgi:hypothetical protein